VPGIANLLLVIDDQLVIPCRLDPELRLAVSGVNVNVRPLLLA
jgi:hypothetical protein